MFLQYEDTSVFFKFIQETPQKDTGGKENFHLSQVEQDKENLKKNLLVLHGWGAQHTTLTPVYTHLLDRYNVIVLDFPPFGMSGQLARTFKMHDYACLTVAVLRKLDISQCDILCHSFGARVAAVLTGGGIAEGAGISIDSIVITGGAGLRPRFRLKRNIKTALYKVHKKLARWGILQKGGLLRYFSADYQALPEDVRSTFKNVVSQDLLPQFKQITQRTLLIYGKDDRDTPVYMAKRLQKAMPNAKLIVLKNCGHYCFLQKTMEFNSHIFSFLTAQKV